MSDFAFSESVLIVDDVAVDREATANLVRKLGYGALPAVSSADALVRIARERPLMVLMALDLEGESGETCCGVIKANAELKNLPVVMMTRGRGEAEVKRALHSGADDFLTKPLVEAQLGAKIAAVQAGAKRSGLLALPAAGATILVADDDAIVRNLLQRTLEAAGYKVLTADNGLAALQVLNSTPVTPDLAVIDLFMPGVGGLELIRKIRETPMWAALPVIVVSAVRRDSAMSSELGRLGVADLIDKDDALLDLVAKRTSELLYRGENARHERRIDFFRVCDFRRGGEDTWMTGLITNLAVNGGVFVRTLTCANAGAVIDLRFDISGAGDLLVAKAAVAWSKELDAGKLRGAYGMGLRLLDVPAETRAVFAQLHAQANQK